MFDRRDVEIGRDGVGEIKCILHPVFAHHRARARPSKNGHARNAGLGGGHNRVGGRRLETIEDGAEAPQRVPVGVGRDFGERRYPRLKLFFCSRFALVGAVRAGRHEARSVLNQALGAGAFLVHVLAKGIALGSDGKGRRENRNQKSAEDEHGSEIPICGELIKAVSWPSRGDSATVANVLAALGRFVLRPLGDTLAALAVPYFALKARALEGRRGLGLSLRVALQQVYFTAVEPLPVFAFISVVVGAVLLLIASALMQPQGLAPQLPALMTPAIVREVIPLLLGLVLVARTGTAVTTEIGTLRITHELDALEAARMNIDAYVVLPRVIGLTVAGAALMVLSGLAALVGGAMFASLSPHIARVVTVPALLAQLTTRALVTTAAKGATFGFLVACIACRHGLAVKNSSREIAVAGGRATLQSTLACFVVDALFILGDLDS